MHHRLLSTFWSLVAALLFGAGLVAGSGHDYEIGQPFPQHLAAYVGSGSTFFVGAVIAAATASVIWALAAPEPEPDMG